MSFSITDGLTFDDVLLQPKYSDIESRSQIDVSIEVGYHKGHSIKYNHPIIPANMQSICGEEMTIEVIKSGGLAILHRFMEPQEQLKIAQGICSNGAVGNNWYYNFAASVGVKLHDREMVDQFYKMGVMNICIDIAHGDSKLCVDMIEWIKANKPDMFIIAGNVATGDGAERLWKAGADVVKVGIGPGSLCTTRIETGNGVPQLTALIDVYQRRANINCYIKKPMYIIADGGLKNSGDCIKALCFADMIMAGNIFAGCIETPSKQIKINGIEYKEYVGSSTHKTSHVEGVEALVHPKGTFKSVLDKLLEGLRSGMSYQNAHNLSELKDNPQFVRITNSGLVESHPHDVRIIK